MIQDLFASSTKLNQIHLPDADVSYLREFNLGVHPLQMMQALINETPWRQEDINVWGKTFRQPRLVAWYGDPGHAYRYSGIALEPLPWTDRISGIKARVEAQVATTFNSVLLNYYRDQNDSMGMHSDNEKELGPRPTIASISMGAERSFLLKSKLHPDTKIVKLPLASGSLLLMKGDTQKNYKHGIGKEKHVVGARVNLTFRVILPQ